MFRLFSWPSKRERKERIADARRSREEAEEKLREAKQIEREFHDLVESNHFAAIVLRQIWKNQ